MKKSTILCAIFSMFWASVCHASNDNFPLGARSSGMASSSVVLTDIWSSSNNQAGLAFLKQPTAAAYYENRLNVKSLSLQAGAFAMPIHATVVGFNYHYFGFSKYNESKFGLAVAKRLGEKFAVGVQLDYYLTHFAGDYRNTGFLCGEIGVLYEPVENLTIGAHLFNLTRSRQKVDYDRRAPTIMRLGAGYTIQEKATISVETEKNLLMDVIFKAGLEYSPIDDLFLRCGMSTGVLYQYSFGVGYGWKNITVDISFSHHKFFGYSPHISLIAKL